MSTELSARYSVLIEQDLAGADLPFRWRGGNLALDFANTTAWNPDPTTGRTDVMRPEYERLTRYSRIVEFGVEAGALTEREAVVLLATAEQRPDEAERALSLAFILRLAIHRIFSAVTHGDPPDRSALATLNALLPEALGSCRLNVGEEGFAWEWTTDSVSLSRPLWPVIHTAATLLTSNTLSKVRQCEGPGCGWLFLDASRAGNRRWCAMSDCGNRVKAHRRRGESAVPAETEKAVAEERRRLSRELHDSVSQALYSIALGTRTARTLLDQDPDRAAEPLEFALAQAERGLAEMRALIFDLRPEALAQEGLVAALRRQADVLRVRHGIQIELSLSEEPDVALAVKETLYRVAQEALHNTGKHAQADTVSVSLQCRPREIQLEIRDNGRGFDPAAFYPGHLGLHSMRERVAHVGGTLRIESGPGTGTRVRVHIAAGRRG